MPTGTPTGFACRPLASRRQVGLSVLAGTMLLIAASRWVGPAEAQLAGPRVDRKPAEAESDRGSGAGRPEPRQGPPSNERRPGGAVPEGGAENEQAPDEPAPRGCPVNDRKLELIV